MSYAQYGEAIRRTTMKASMRTEWGKRGKRVHIEDEVGENGGGGWG
jgi:hypothetical protein